MADPLDRIHIVDLMLRTVIGITADERRERQDVVLNVTLHADLRKAGRSDDMADTVDYKAVKKNIIRLLEDESFRLVEHLAERIAETVLADPRVRRVDVRVEKPGALRFARSVGVEITREAGDAAP